MGILRRTFATQAPCATILIRLIVGGTFLSEGIQKFLFVEELGVGRFVKIGIPHPELMAPFVGLCEIVCGVLLILGLMTRLAAIPMIINISVAILSTKIPLLLGHGLWVFNLPKASSYGFWSMMHEARTDFAMLLGGDIPADRRRGMSVARCVVQPAVETVGDAPLLRPPKGDDLARCGRYDPYSHTTCHRQPIILGLPLRRFRWLRNHTDRAGNGPQVSRPMTWQEAIKCLF